MESKYLKIGNESFDAISQQGSFIGKMGPLYLLILGFFMLKEFRKISLSPEIFMCENFGYVPFHSP